MIKGKEGWKQQELEKDDDDAMMVWYGMARGAIKW